MKKFKLKPGQVDYTDIRWAPVINCVLKCGQEILLVKRSKDTNFYPEYWNGISGFLDDQKSLKEKVEEEIKEETGFLQKDIEKIKPGEIFHHNEPKYKKTWIIHPVLVEIGKKKQKVSLDWEASDYKWVKLQEAKKLKLLPGFDKVLKTFGLF